MIQIGYYMQTPNSMDYRQLNFLKLYSIIFLAHLSIITMLLHWIIIFPTPFKHSSPLFFFSLFDSLNFFLEKIRAEPNVNEVLQQNVISLINFVLIQVSFWSIDLNTIQSKINF